MDQTFIFEKTYDERLQKYVDVFYDMSAKQVMKEWGDYLESIVERFGWQAIWKIPPHVCEHFNITYPILALVYVEDTNFKNLTSVVRVLTIENGLKFSENITTDLFNLWPTEEQDVTFVLNLPGMCEALDLYRFFIKYLWRPYDEENLENNFFRNCLVPRLKLYYELKQSGTSKYLRDYYRLQLIECKEKYDKLKKLQVELQDDDLECFDNTVPEQFRNIHNSIVKLRRTLEIFENPVLREKVFEKNNSNVANLWLVIYSDKEFDGYLEFINNVKAFSNSNSEFKTAKSLQEALNLACTNDTIFIGSGNQEVESLGSFRDGGKIINVNYPKEAVITTTNEYLLFNLNHGELILQNLTFELNTTRYGIRVRNGATLKLENCCIQGYNNMTTGKENISLMSTQQGIICDPEGCVNLQNCQFSFLGTALCMDSGAASLYDCAVDHVRCAVRTQNCANFKLVNCEFNRCLECAIQVKVDDHNKETDSKISIIRGGVDLLQSMPNIELLDTKINSAPQVIITKKLRYCPVKDIFNNPAYNPSFCKTLNGNIADEHI